MTNIQGELSIPRDGLVGEWLLDGNSYDTSGNGNNGTATNITWVDADKGYVKSVGSFDGTSSYILTGKTISIPNITANFWIKPIFARGNTDYQYYRFISRFSDNYGEGSFIIDTYNNAGGYNDIRFWVIIGGVTYIQTFTDVLIENIWQQVTITYDGNDVKLYINGILKGTENIGAGNIPDNSEYIGIGEDQRGTRNEWYYGYMGLVRIYNRTISQKEINTLYLEGQRKLGLGYYKNSQILIDTTIPNFQTKFTPVAIPKPILHIDGTNDGTTYYDQSGNGNHWTKYGTVTTSQVGLYKEMKFDGSTGYLTINKAFTPINNFTWSIKRKFNASANGYIFQYRADPSSGASSGFLIYRDGTNIRYRKYLDASNIEDHYLDVSILNDGKIHKLDIVQDSVNGVKAYVDGTLLYTSTSTSDVYISSTETISNLGCNNDDGTQNYFVNDSIYSMKMWDIPLTPTKIQQLYYSNYIQ